MFEIVLLWLALSVVAGIVAGAKGRNGFGYFVLALLLSPLIGLILAAALPRLNAQVAPPAPAADPRRTRACPECAEPILREARKCKHCGSPVTPDPWLPPVEPTPAQHGRSDPHPSAAAGVMVDARAPPFWRVGIREPIFLAPVRTGAEADAAGGDSSALLRRLCREGEPVELVRLAGDTGSRLAVMASREGLFGRTRAPVGELDQTLAADLLAHIGAGGDVTARVHRLPADRAGGDALILHIRKHAAAG